MKNDYNINFDLNKFLKNIELKKKYIKNLKHKIFLLNNIKKKNYKFLNRINVKKKNYFHKYNPLVVYIVSFSFPRSNSFLYVSDFAGNLKFFCSAGSFNSTGKNKKIRWIVFKKFYKVLLNLKFLKNKPIALHLKNVRLNKSWIIKKLKKKFFIKIIQNFDLYPHNGCRKKKVRRKKFKKRRGG